MEVQTLTDQERLVFFEYCHRICETEKVAASHPAEIVVLDKIASQLERSLAEPFMQNYAELLRIARNEVLSQYKDRMGDNTWVEDVELEQR